MLDEWELGREKFLMGFGLFDYFYVLQVVPQADRVLIRLEELPQVFHRRLYHCQD